MPPHHQQAMPLRQALVRSLAGEGGSVRAVPFSRWAYEAFILGETPRDTRLLDPLEATSLIDAKAEATARWSWSRGQRLGLRQLGEGMDVLHVFAVREKSQKRPVYRGHVQRMEPVHWLEKLCEIDLNEIAGLPGFRVGSEISIHEHRQAQRPEGARFSR